MNSLFWIFYFIFVASAQLIIRVYFTNLRKYVKLIKNINIEGGATVGSFESNAHKD